MIKFKKYLDEFPFFKKSFGCIRSNSTNILNPRGQSSFWKFTSLAPPRLAPPRLTAPSCYILPWFLYLLPARRRMGIPRGFPILPHSQSSFHKRPWGWSASTYNMHHNLGTVQNHTGIEFLFSRAIFHLNCSFTKKWVLLLIRLYYFQNEKNTRKSKLA